MERVLASVAAKEVITNMQGASVDERDDELQPAVTAFDVVR